ncbi:aminoacyl-tRNA hydrolase [Ectothiorhodospiraceae bacterium WFHF3C12]|nr:aminoacyl-tRNA hydrolase [Ectothiorhodospiraceae bacterium WFHF3C12]
MSDIPVRVVVGLGNPGPRYDRTRHNAGFWFVDELARLHGGSFRSERKFNGQLARISIAGEDVVLLKPETFMNRSGEALGPLLRFFKVDPAAMLVAHDEIDLSPGGLKLKQDGGHGGHNGLRDTIRVLGTRAFGRLRIGVGHPGHKDDVVPYVLRVAPAAEQAEIDRAVERAAAAVPLLVEGDWARAYQRLHTAEKAE